MIDLADLAMAYRLRWKRRRLRARSVRKSFDLNSVCDRSEHVALGDVLCFAVLRNEIERLPYFLAHYRALGVEHFFIVDNSSDDGSFGYLLDQDDVSLWCTEKSYKKSRFGMDWLNFLLSKHGHNHWCLTVDLDEILIYPNWQTRDLKSLAEWLERCEVERFGSMMLDMYPQTSLMDHNAEDLQPFKSLSWFDAGNYQIRRQSRLRNLWIQGGPRARTFFARDPNKAPTLNKIPFVKWHRTYVYNSSTHNMLPRRLNEIYDAEGGEQTSGVLLHTKFLPSIGSKSAEEKLRGEHFANSTLYQDYYDELVANPTLWNEMSTKLTGWRQLEALGLMSRGGWV